MSMSTTTRIAETSMNPLVSIKEEVHEIDTLENEETPPKKDNMARKVTPLQNTPTKNQNKATSIQVSNEDLRTIYERKKTQKGTKFFSLEDDPEDIIYSSALTPDNKSLIVGCRRGSIKIFDLETKQVVHRFQNAHPDEVRELAASSDGRYLVSSSFDYSVKVWDLEAKEQVHQFVNIHRFSFCSVAVTSDGRYIVTGSGDCSMKLIDVEKKEEAHDFEYHHDMSIFSVVVTPDDRYIISSSEDKSIKIVDLQTRQQVHHFENVHLDEIKSIAASPNNRLIVSGSKDKSIKVFDIETKQQVHHFQNAHESGVRSVAFTPDSRYIISGSFDGSIKIHDLEIKQQVHHLKKIHKDPVTSLLVASDNKFFVSVSANGAIKGFDLDIKQPLHHIKDFMSSSVRSMVLMSNNKHLITGSQRGAIKIYDIETKERVYYCESADQDNFIAMAVTSDDKLLILASDHDVKVLDLETKQEVHQFEDEEGWISSVAITPDNKHIITGGLSRSIGVYDLQTKQQVHRFQTEDVVRSLVLTADGRYIISGCNEGWIQVFDLSTKQQSHCFQNAHQDDVRSVVVTPDSKFIISGSHDQSIKIFDLETKQQVHHFEGAHEDPIGSVAVSSDSRYIVSISARFLKVFDFQTKQQLHSFKQSSHHPISTVVVASDSSFIACNLQGEDLGIFELETRQKENLQAFTKFDPNNKSLISIPDCAILDQELYFIHKGMKQFSVFNNTDSFLFDKSTEHSISEAVKLPDLSVLPFRWNILHVVSIYANHSFIENMPGYSQFKMPFLLDISNNTPLHYLIAHKNLNTITANIIFRYICDYLEDCYPKSPFEFQKIIESLDPLLPFILQKVDVKTRQKFLRIVDSENPLPFRNPAPIFGTILSEAAFFCDSPVLTQGTRDKIWNERGTTQVEFRSNFLRLDYDVLSEDMSKMIDCLRTQEAQEIFRMPVIMRLIDHLWGQAETPLIIFFAIYSAFMIALSIYLTFDDRSLAYEVVLIPLSVLLTANESWQIFYSRRGYLKNLWNWIDLSHLPLTIVFLVTRIAGNENELARAWISTIIIILGYIRWISLLKIFKPTRHLIQVVITILKDMTSFVVVIALIIIAFSLIFLVFNREASYGDYLYEAYNVMYGPVDIEDGAAWPFSQKLLMAVLAFFLNVVLLNLLISIMGDSYGQVLEMRDRTDALTRLEMISEAIIYKKFTKFYHHPTRGYLVYCLPVELEEEENTQSFESESIVEAMKRVIQQNNEDSRQEAQALNETMNKKISALEGQIAAMKTEMVAMNKEIMETVLKEFSRLKPSFPIKTQK